MKLTLLIAILLFTFTTSALAQNASVYTSTKTGACRTISSNPNEAGSYEGECPGVGGYKVRLLEGDIRQTINIITPAKKKFELNFWGFYSGFSAIGEKIEWRTKKGVPVALIARYNVAGADDSNGLYHRICPRTGSRSSHRSCFSFSDARPPRRTTSSATRTCSNS